VEKRKAKNIAATCQRLKGSGMDVKTIMRHGIMVTRSAEHHQQRKKTAAIMAGRRVTSIGCCRLSCIVAALAYLPRSFAPSRDSTCRARRYIAPYAGVLRALLMVRFARCLCSTRHIFGVCACHGIALLRAWCLLRARRFLPRALLLFADHW